MVSRGWKIAGIVAVVLLGTLGALVPRIARARVVRQVDERCHRVLDGRCSVGDVALALDGVLLRDVELRMRGTRYVARAHRIGVRLRWAPLLFGGSQPVDVEVDGVDVRGRVALTTLLDDLRHREANPAPTRRSRVRLRALHVTGVSVAFSIAQLTGRDLDLSLRDAGGEWDHDAGRITVRWADASVAYGASRAHTGSCTALHGIDPTTSLDCREFEGALDLAERNDLRAGLEEVLQAVSHREGAGQGSEPVAADARPESLRQVQVRMREGRVKLQHRNDVIADLAPASVAVLAEQGGLREATFQLGGDDDRQPSLSLTFNRMHEPWQIDLDAAALPLRQLAPWIPSVPWHGTENGRAHARVHVEPGDAPERLDVSGDVFVEDFGLQHPGLAREPIDGLSVSLDGRLAIDLAQRRVATQGLHWTVNGIPFTAAGWVQRDADHTALDVSLNVSPFACDGGLRSMPAPVTGVTASLGLSGTVGGSAHLALDTRDLRNTAFAYRVDDGCSVSHAGWGIHVRRFAEPFVQRVMEPGGHVRAFVTGPGSPAWVPVEAMPPTLLNAVVSREDGSFYQHRGFDAGQIRGALVRNIAEHRFAYGASTISMQLVKNVFLAREKTLVRKLQEVVLTWWIEQSLDKSSILELYLNVVEFGPGIYGVGPAARFFFGREPRELTTLQAIYLATLLPAPIPRFAIFQRGSAPADTLARLRAIARAMAANRMLAPAEAEAAQHEVFAFRPQASSVPGASTMTVDAATTDEMARTLSARAMVNVVPPGTPSDDAPTTETPTENTAPEGTSDDNPPGAATPAERAP